MKITKLSDEMIARIAAGEVITSPLSVIKELIENSLDACATQIQICITKDFSRIEVIDNGIGISHDNIAYVCKRHYTSKFTGSLFTVDTFGFRGEALASISQCSQVQIFTRQKDTDFGYKAVYKDYNLIQNDPCATNFGTKIVIENLFYNNEIRKKHFQNKKDEIRDILQTIMFLIIFHNQTHFKVYVDKILKLFHDPEKYKAKDSFQSSSVKKIKTCSLVLSDNLNIKKQIIHDIFKIPNHLFLENNPLCTIIGSEYGHHSNKYLFILFINKRLVSNVYLKEKILKIYKEILPKHKYPFVYIEISINPSLIDVNIHPAKKEVVFEEEKERCEEVLSFIKNSLENSYSAYEKNSMAVDLSESFLSSSYAGLRQRKKSQERGIQPYKNIYTDPDASSIIDFTEVRKKHNEDDPIKIYNFESIRGLKNEIKEIEPGFCKNLVYVGEFNGNILVQSGIFLMECKYAEFLFLFYKYYITQNFGNLDSFSFISKNTLKTHNNKTINDFQNMKKILLDMGTKKRNILTNYFGFLIDNEQVCKIPQILDVTIENSLCQFLLKINSFELKNEKETFNEIIEILSLHFTKETDKSQTSFNKIKRKAIATKETLNCFSILTSLTDLYKLFERC